MGGSTDQCHGSAHEDRIGQETESRYRLLRDSLRDAFVQVAMDGRILDFNTLYCELLGYAAGELCTLRFQDLTPERWHAREAEIVAEQVLPRGYSDVYEKEYRRKDGTILPVELRTVLERDTAGCPVAMWAIVRDISERKRTEAALRESEARYRALAEGLPAVLMRFDREGRVVYLSPQAEGITGIPVARFVGRTNREVGMPEALCQLWEAAIARVFATAAAESLEFPIHTRDGERTFLLKLVPELDADGTAVRHVLGISTDITERKLSEAALNAAKTRAETDKRHLEAVLQALPVGVVVTDAQGGILLTNRRDEDIWGPRPPTFDIGDYSQYRARWAESGEPVAPSQWAAARAVSEGEAVLGQILEIERFDGGRRWVHNSAVPILDELGRPAGCAVAIQDITDLWQAEAALRESEVRLRLALQATRDVIWDWDIEQDEQRWSVAGVETFGWTDIVDTPQTADWWIERVHVDDRQRVRASFHRALDDPATTHWQDEYRFLRRDGSVADVLDRGFILRDGSGRPTRMIGAMQDISERSRVQAALHASEARFRALVTATSDAVYQMSSDWSQMIYLRGQDLIADTEGPDDTWLEKYILPEDRDCVWAAIDAAIRTTSVFVLEHRVRRLDGGVGWTFSRAVPILDASGRILEWFGAASDITQRKAAEQALLETDRRKTAFLSMLGHELRNPLAPIRNSLYVLRCAVPGGEQALQAQETIERQVGYLTRLVDDLLDITRIERGKIALKCEPVELGELVQRTLADYREVFTQGECALDLALPREALWVSADPTRIAQVIGNLLSNAAKFTPPGGRVSVSLEQSPSSAEALIRVRDTGIGIAPEMLAWVLEPFAQADTSLDRSRGGLGLGLATVRGLVEQHGGRVNVASEGLGRGTEVTVRLPIEWAEPPEAAVSQPVANGGQRCVLIIEDNRDAGESLCLLLQLLGHRAEVAYSGPDGVARAQSLAPDVILCDIGPPGMDGYAVARALRGDRRLHGAKLVALSGYTGSEEVAKAQEAGFDSHFAKPLCLETLQAILADAEREGD